MSAYKNYGKITINPTKMDPDGTTYDLYKKTTSTGSSVGEIPTCTMRFVGEGDAYHDGNYFYTKCVNGVISTEHVVTNGDRMKNFDITLENVVCGSIVEFNWSTDLWGELVNLSSDIDGDAWQYASLGGYGAANESTFFVASTTPGSTSVITLTATEGNSWG